MDSWTLAPSEVLGQARDFIADRPWLFATSHAENAPHEYTIAHWHRDREAFHDFVQLIGEHGQRERLGEHTERCLHVDGHRYWVTRYPTLVHRARTDTAGTLERVTVAYRHPKQSEAELTDAIHHALAVGATQLAICDALEISRVTLRRWLRDGLPAELAANKRTAARTRHEPEASGQKSSSGAGSRTAG